MYSISRSNGNTILAESFIKRRHLIHSFIVCSQCAVRSVGTHYGAQRMTESMPQLLATGATLENYGASELYSVSGRHMYFKGPMRLGMLYRFSARIST